MNVFNVGSTNPPLWEWYEQGLTGSWEDTPTVGLFAGDATYGHTLDDLLTPPELPYEPTDFVAFWKSLAAQADELEPSLTIRETIQAPEELSDSHDLHTATFISTGGFEIGCWVALPKSGEPSRNLTFGHGYGGRTFPDLEQGLIEEDDAVILPCTRGLGELSTRAAIPAPGREHVLQGIDDRDAYILGGCVTDIWRATAELDHFVGTRSRHYYGASFGGGIGALALQKGLYATAALHVPTFGHHPMRLRWPCIGSGAGLRERYLEDQSITEVLAYFDAATAATHVDTPTLVSVAQWDPAVPPPGQFAIFHALAGEKQLVIQDAAYTEFPGEPAQERARVELTRRWLHSGD